MISGLDEDLMKVLGFVVELTHEIYVALDGVNVEHLFLIAVFGLFGLVKSVANLLRPLFVDTDSLAHNGFL